ncbi:hypothetical protein PMIN03_003841 [Paraphaeosphaeria minitans]
MRLPLYLPCLLPLAAALVHRAPAGIQVTPHVLSLVAAPHPHPITPSTRHLHRRRRRNNTNGKRQVFAVPGLVVPGLGIAPVVVPGSLPVVGGDGAVSPGVSGGAAVQAAPLVGLASPVGVVPPVGLASPEDVVPPVALPSPVDVSFPTYVSSLPADLPPPATAQDANSDPESTSFPDSFSPATVAEAAIEQPVDTIGGRVYMTNVTLAGHPYTLILDTGSSDTWIAASDFTCTGRISHARLPQRSCGFGELYDVVDSKTYDPIPGRAFGVKYSDGEYLMGEMGVEELRVGDVDGGKGGLTVRQTIGVVERGWWMGDGRSSGLMGLAFPTLASNYRDLNYTTVVGSLFETHQIPPVFSLALSRPTQQSPTAGGLLAIGGIPDVPYTPPFVRVPITPVFAHTYAFYTIPVDGFAIMPPSGPATASFANTSSSVSPSTRQRVHRQSGAPLQMILDSGSTLLYLPDDTADHLASLFSPPARYVPSSNTYITSCSAQQPRFGVVIGGTTFYINPEDMLTREGRGRCSLAVQRMEDGDAVLGDAWLKSVLVVFDLRPEGEGMGVWVAGREVY